jgi:hypothetical protein
MMKDELINIWKEGDELMFRDKKTDKEMITQYLNEKTLKGSWNIKFNFIFYGIIQITNLILLSMNLAGYMNNTSLNWILVPLMLVTIGILIFGMDLFYKLREINNYSESLHSLITKQLRFFRRPYELWLILSSFSAIILISNVNLYIDNDNGAYAINNKVLFWGVTIGAFLFIYGTQKMASLVSLRSLKVYLSDLQKGVLNQSEQLERSRKRLIWLYVAIFILLTISLMLGILKAIQ